MIQQISRENWTECQSLSQHFTLCSCKMLLHCEAAGTGGECKQPRGAGAPSTSENVSEGLGLWKSATSAGPGSTQSSQLYCKRSQERSDSLPSPVSTWEAGERECEKLSFHILIASNLVADHLSTLFSFFLSLWHMCWLSKSLPDVKFFQITTPFTLSH